MSTPRRPVADDRRREPPLAVADTEKIDEAAEPTAHPDAAGEDVADEAGSLLENAEGNVW